MKNGTQGYEHGARVRTNGRYFAQIGTADGLEAEAPDDNPDDHLATVQERGAVSLFFAPDETVPKNDEGEEENGRTPDILDELLEMQPELRA